MTELRLIAGEESWDGPFREGPLPGRLPHGRHGLPRDFVREHQRARLLGGMANALAKHGYAEINTTLVSQCAGVSSGTFYKHFGNLWDCLLAAYVTGAERLCEGIEAACAEHDGGPAGLAAGIEAALAFCDADPAAALLLCTQPPREGVAVRTVRRNLVRRLAKMLRGGGPAGASRPSGLDERLIGATLAFVGARLAAGQSERLAELGPDLLAILAPARRAA